jgi:hypothetical protein
MPFTRSAHVGRPSDLTLALGLFEGSGGILGFEAVVKSRLLAELGRELDLLDVRLEDAETL